jgi:cytochrome P450
MLLRTASDAHMIMEVGLRGSQVRGAAQSFATLRTYFEGLINDAGGRAERMWPWARGFPAPWIASNLSLVASAGTVTTAGLIGSAVMTLSSQPELIEKVAEDRDLAVALAAETVRFDGPAQVGSRVPIQDAEVGGVPVRAGVPVVLLLGAANRDRRVWRDPDTFDIYRQGTDRALGFGHGRHRCLGTGLAVMEAAEVLMALASRFARLLVVDCRQRGMLSARGPERLMVREAGR